MGKIFEDILLAFDLDGTLIDSAYDITTAVNKTLSDEGLSPVSLELVKSHIGEGPRKLLMSFFPQTHLGHPEHKRIQQLFVRNYEETCTQSTVLWPHAHEFLSTWPGKLAIITNKSTHFTQIIIRALGLNHYPWVTIICGDTLERKKPDPLPLRHVMELAGAPPEKTIMIGDGTPDMQSAMAAGTRSIAISFGYTTLEKLNQYQPSAILNHYQQLSDLIRKLLTT